MRAQTSFLCSLPGEVECQHLLTVENMHDDCATRVPARGNIAG